MYHHIRDVVPSDDRTYDGAAFALWPVSRNILGLQNLIHIKKIKKHSLFMLFVELLLDFDFGAFPF